MTGYQIAWAVYVLGGLGCGLSAWLLFRRFGREWGLFFMVTVWVLTLTPYALDQESMILAPAIFIYVMDGFANGFDTVQPIALVMAGVWFVALLLALVFLFLTRSRHETQLADTDEAPSVSADEEDAREALLKGDIPLRAER